MRTIAVESRGKYVEISNTAEMKREQGQRIKKKGGIG
jgi:hypothetical protein